MANDIGMIKSVQPTLQPQPGNAAQRAGLEQRSQAGAVSRGDARERVEEERPLDEVVSDLNKLVRDLHRELRFSVDQDSGDTVIKVIDRETKEVVRQIPSEELVALRKRLQQAAGVIFRDSA
jgi:flagellar protein FlaG